MTRICEDADAVTELRGSPAWARLWLADLDRFHGDGSALTAAERHRATRFAFEKDSRRFVAARTVLRALLAQEAGVDPASDFSIGDEGKPYLPIPGAPQFNLSHSGRHALIVISEFHAVGVDIEETRAIDDIDELAALHFTVCERSVWPIDALDGTRLACFLRGWTRKEACVKAIGAGLTIDTRSFETELTVGEARVRVPSRNCAATVRVADVDVGPGLLAAVACVDRENPAPRLADLRVRPSVFSD